MFETANVTDWELKVSVLPAVCKADALAYFSRRALAHLPGPQSVSGHVDLLCSAFFFFFFHLPAVYSDSSSTNSVSVSLKLVIFSLALKN